MARSSRFSAVFFPGEPEPIDENLQPGQAKAINAQAKKLRKTIFIGANQTPVLSPGVSSPRTDAKEASLTEAEETKGSRDASDSANVSEGITTHVHAGSVMIQKSHVLRFLSHRAYLVLETTAHGSSAAARLQWYGTQSAYLQRAEPLGSFNLSPNCRVTQTPLQLQIKNPTTLKTLRFKVRSGAPSLAVWTFHFSALLQTLNALKSDAGKYSAEESRNSAGHVAPAADQNIPLVHFTLNAGNVSGPVSAEKKKAVLRLQEAMKKAVASRREGKK